VCGPGEQYGSERDGRAESTDEVAFSHCGQANPTRFCGAFACIWPQQEAAHAWVRSQGSRV
jgi:hypothetical protein